MQGASRAGLPRAGGTQAMVDEVGPKVKQLVGQVDRESDREAAGEITASCANGGSLAFEDDLTNWGLSKISPTKVLLSRNRRPQKLT